MNDETVCSLQRYLVRSSGGRLGNERTKKVWQQTKYLFHLKSNQAYSSFRNLYGEPMQSLDIPPFANPPGGLQASGRRKLGEFKMSNDTFNYNQEIEVANDEPFSPMSQMNSVLYHNRSASRRAPEQTTDLPSNEENNDKPDAKRSGKIYRVGSGIS